MVKSLIVIDIWMIQTEIIGWDTPATKITQLGRQSASKFADQRSAKEREQTARISTQKVN